MRYALQHRKTQELLLESHQDRWILVPFFFNDRGSAIQKTLLGLLQELLYSILRHYEDLIEVVISSSLQSILPDYSTLVPDLDKQRSPRIICSRKSMETAHRLIKDNIEPGSARGLYSEDVLKNVLVAAVRQKKVPMNVLFFIDALDEQQDSHMDLVNLLKCLSSTENLKTVHVEFCVTSRRESIFPGAFNQSSRLAIQDWTHSDIEQYVTGRTESAFDDLAFPTNDRELLKPLCNEVTERAKGVFIWVELVANELVQGIIDGNSVPQLRQSLSLIPTELDALYRRIIQKRKPEHVHEMYIMSQILLCSLTPISLQSLMAITDVCLSDLAVEEMSVIRMQQRLVSRSGGLIEVCKEIGDKEIDGKEIGEKENGNYMETLIRSELFSPRDKSNKKLHNVQFLHQTVKSFLENPTLTKSLFKDPERFPTKDGWSYLLQFSVGAIAKVVFEQVLAHRCTIMGLFYYAWRVEQHSKTNCADLLDLLLTEHRDYFPEAFDTWLCTEPRVDYCWVDCIHTMPHGRIRPDGLNLWEICEAADEVYAYEFRLLASFRCLASPISSASRAFDLLFLATLAGIWYYVKRKVLGGALMVCPHTTRSLLWATVSCSPWKNSTIPVSKRIDMLDFLISMGSNVDLAYRKLSPLGHALYYFHHDEHPHNIAILRKLLCAGANPDTLISKEVAIVWVMRSFGELGTALNSLDRNEILRLLLEHGANPRFVDTSGFEPLFYSINEGNAVQAETLLRYGADPSNFGHRISALENPNEFPKSVFEAGARAGRGFYKRARKFRRNAARMHDLLMRYKNPQRTGPLCQCKQRPSNSGTEKSSTHPPCHQVQKTKL